MIRSSSQIRSLKWRIAIFTNGSRKNNGQGTSNSYTTQHAVSSSAADINHLERAEKPHMVPTLTIPDTGIRVTLWTEEVLIRPFKKFKGTVTSRSLAEIIL